MALPKKYEGLEDALNVAAEIISECTGIPGTGSVAIWGIKEVLSHIPIYTLKEVLNKKSIKALGIPNDKCDFVIEQTRDALLSIDSVDYNPVVFRKEIFTKNCYFPTLIGADLVENLHLGDDADLLKAIRFVLATYLLHWSEEPDFPLETRQELLLLKSDVKKNTKDIVNIKKMIESLRTRIKFLEDERKEPIPAELTVIPNSISNLFGRESVIIDTTTKLKTDHIICLTADGGLGKTAIAKRIINNIRKDIGKEGSKHKYVAWITSSGNLKEDLQHINTPNYSTDNQEDKYIKVCRFLQSNPTFLVIDNMDEIPSHEDINILNTISGKSTILITSRAAIDSFSSYELQPLDRNVAVVLFYSHYFHNPAITALSHEKINEDISTGRIEDVYKIVDATGGNALIIELIAKTAHADVLSVTELWEKVSSGIFGFESKTEVQTDHSGNHPESKLSIDEQMRRLYSMLKLTDKQKEIMSFISLFPAEHDIFSNVFKWAGFFDHGANDMMYLVERGWIIREDDYYSIHTIVRESINMQNEKSGEGVSILDYEELIKKLTRINGYIPRTTEYNLAQKLSFVPQTVGKLLSENYTFNTTIGKFLHNLAYLYKDQGNYDEALKFYNMTLEIREKILGKDHPDTAITYNNIADVYHVQGNYDEALNFNYMALEIREKKLGKDHPYTAITYNNIACIYKAQGNYDEALKFYNMALKIQEKELGKEHPDTALTYDNMAQVYCAQGNYDEALNFYNIALEIQENKLGKGHPDTAITYNNIAEVYHVQGNYDEALKFYNIALEIQENKLGKDHPDTATTYNNMACVYKDQGNCVEALKFFKMALEIQENRTGKDHPNTAIAYNNIAGVFRDQGIYYKALKFYDMALEIQENKLVKGHPDTAITYNNKAYTYYAQGNYDDALKYYNMSLEIREKKLGKDHPSTATTYNNIALVYGALGNYNEALKYYKLALRAFEKRLGIHQKTASVHENLAYLYYIRGNRKDARKHLEKAMEIRKKLNDK